MNRTKKSRRTKAQSAFDEAVRAVTAAGYVPDGTTASTFGKVITAASYPLAGKLVTMGGRMRFRLPGTEERVTIGPRTTCFYTVKPAHRSYGQARAAGGFKNVRTGELEEIQANIELRVAAGESAVFARFSDENTHHD